MGISEEHKKELKALIKEENEEMEKRLAKKIIPENYTRCKNCGSVVKDSIPCPYCKKEPTKEKELLDEVFGDNVDKEINKNEKT